MEVMSLSYYGILLQVNIIIMIICTRTKCNHLCSFSNQNRIPH